MRSVKVLVLLTLLAAVPILAAEEPTRAAAKPLATMHVTPDAVSWEAEAGQGLELTVASPGGTVQRREFAAGETPTFDLYDAGGKRLPDGVYTYELRTARELRPGRSLLLSGTLEVRGGSFVDLQEPKSSKSGGLKPVFEADHVISDNLIVDGSACIGEYCAENDADGTLGLKLKAPELAIVFEDAPGCCSSDQDWAIQVNDIFTGGQERFSILELDDPVTTPFTIRGGAPDHSFYVNSSGNIGLGTSTPGAKLHLYGTATSDVVASAGPDPTNGPAFNLGYGGNSFGRGSGFLNVRPDASATAPNPSLRFLTANVERMIITNTGRVGIGTSAPANQLDVKVNEFAVVARLQNLSGIGYSGIEYLDESSTASLFFGIDNAANTTRFNSVNNHPIVILTNSTERMRVTSAGDVGIGTSSPSSKLHVNGGDIRVSGGSFIDDGVTLFAPDYVFEPDYELMPLDQLAAFVRAEKHLPNVPKAAEIRASGLNLGHFQMRLLEKIEELTLYALAQEERLATQQATIAELAAKVEKLEEK